MLNTMQEIRETSAYRLVFCLEGEWENVLHVSSIKSAFIV